MHHSFVPFLLMLKCIQHCPQCWQICNYDVLEQDFKNIVKSASSQLPGTQNGAAWNQTSDLMFLHDKLRSTVHWIADCEKGRIPQPKDCNLKSNCSVLDALCNKHSIPITFPQPNSFAEHINKCCKNVKMEYWSRNRHHCSLTHTERAMQKSRLHVPCHWLCLIAKKS